MGHALVARACGMRIRGITLFMLGGVAELGDEPPSPGTEFLMAVAGPVVSAALGLFFGVLALAGDALDWSRALIVIFVYLATINFLVLLFNLIPAFPLDGGRVLRSILWAALGNQRKATFWAALVGRGFAWVLIAWGIVNFFAGNWIGGIWLGLIGMFLNNAAQSSYQQVLIKQYLQGEPVRRFMTPNPIAVSPFLNLEQFVEDYVYRFHHHAYPVQSESHLQGMIVTDDLQQIPRGEWPVHTVSDVMTSDLATVSIAADADALLALEHMQRSGRSRLLVTEADRLVGILSLKDLLHFLNLKLELEGQSEVVPATQPEFEPEEHPVHL
jgi:Zn-dependent protease/CBS domain-containing protein